MGSTAMGLLIKAAASVLTDERVRKRIGWIVAAILSPMVILAALFLSLLSGATAHNNIAVESAFYGSVPPIGAPLEYQTQLALIQRSFSELDTAVAALNSQAEDGVMLDVTRVKAVFFALSYAPGIPALTDVTAFADCFVAFETRRFTAADGDGNAVEETRTVAVPLLLDEMYRNLAAWMNAEITPEIKANAESIYEMITKGGSVSGAPIPPPGPPLIGADGFHSPLGAGWQERVTSEFGWRNCPFHGRELHSGIDLAAPTGTPIAAALSGTVTVSRYHSSLGNYTVIDHGGGLTTTYAHQSQRLVSVGEAVTAGQIIGLVGSTGNSTGPHLHLEVRVNGQLQNPRGYLP